MKKTDWALLLATAIYSYIFYQQGAGVNFLLFTVLVITILGLTKPVAGNSRWLLFAGLALASGVFVFIHSSWLSVLANLLSLLVLAGASVAPGSSVIMSLISAAGSVAGSPAFLAGGIYNRTQVKDGSQKVYLRGLLAYLIPVLITALFFVIYRNANPLFADFTRAINLDFITAGWMMFTLGGLLVSFGLVRASRFSTLDNWENRQTLNADSQSRSAWNEKKAATLLFVLLNLMLLVMNALDVNYLYLGAGLPEGITHKQFVHNGVGNLILSILLGITVIVFFFRAELNFIKGRTLRTLVYAWIVQNLFMVLSTAIRNEMYIEEALLTYKRIGVFFWTGLAAAGLITTIYKLAKKQPAWYLVRSNSLFALFVLVASAAVDWDAVVTNYNVKRIGQVKDLDKRYLIDLGETNLRQLYELSEREGFEHNIYYHYDYRGIYSNAEKLDRKLSAYLGKMSHEDWRSHSIRKKRVLEDIAALNREGRIRTLDLRCHEGSDLACFTMLYNVQTLKLSSHLRMNARTAEQINTFRNLHLIEVPSLDYPDLIHFVQLKHVRNVKLNKMDATALAFLRKKMPQTEIRVEQPVLTKQNTALR